MGRSFRDRVNQAKSLRGKTATEIASLCRVSERTVRSWLAGSMPDRVNMQTLADALEVPRGWLESGELAGFAGGDVDVSARGVNVAVMFDRLPDREQRAVEDILAALQKK